MNIDEMDDESENQEWESGKPLPRSPDQARQPSKKFRDLLILVLVIWLLIFLFLAPFWAEQLVLGWFLFPIRVIPQVRPDPATVLFGIVSLLTLVVGIQMTAKWWRRERSPEGHTPDDLRMERKITRRISWNITFGLLLMFAVGTAVIGITHQMVWLITGRSTNSFRKTDVYGPFKDLWSSTNEMQRKFSLRQLWFGMGEFHDVHGVFPPGGLMDEKGKLLHGWSMLSGPYIGFYAEGLDIKTPWNQPPNDRLYRCQLSVFCNSTIERKFSPEGYGLSHYSANAYLFPIQQVSTAVPTKDWEVLQIPTGEEEAGKERAGWTLSKITDGEETTLLLGEAAGNYKAWGDPTNMRDPGLGVGRSLDGFGGPPGSDGGFFLMASGAVRFFSNKTDPKIMKAHGTPNGGEQVKLPITP